MTKTDATSHRVRLAATVLLSLGLFGCQQQTSDNAPAPQSERMSPAANADPWESERAAARDALLKLVKSNLRDPDSAQFQNVHYFYTDVQFASGKRLPSGHAICGEVNAKNGFGGYVGFQPFVARFVVSNSDSKVIEDTVTVHIDDPRNEVEHSFYQTAQSTYCQNTVKALG